MPRVVEELAVVHGVLQIQTERRVPADVQGDVVLERDGLGPNGSALDGRGHDHGHVLEEEVVNAWRSLSAVKLERCGGVDELDGHAGVGHVAHVHAPAVVHGSQRQRQGSTHADLLHRRVLSVVGPALEAVLGDDPNRVRTQGSTGYAARAEGLQGSVRKGSGFDQHAVVFAAQGQELVAVAEHAVDGVLHLSEANPVFEITAGGVPMGQRPAVRCDVQAPPIAGE